MEFSMKKCAILIIKSRKRESVEEMKLPNQEFVRTPGKKENYKYLGNGSRHNQTSGDEEKRYQKYLRRMRNRKTKVNSRNLIK